MPGQRPPARVGALAAVSPRVRARGARHVVVRRWCKPTAEGKSCCPAMRTMGVWAASGKRTPGGASRGDHNGAPRTGWRSTPRRPQVVRCGRPQRASAERPPGTCSWRVGATPGAKPGEAAPPSNGRRRASGSAAPWARSGVGAGRTATVPPRNSTSYWVRSCVGTPRMTACGATAHASTWCPMRQRARGGTG